MLGETRIAGDDLVDGLSKAGVRLAVGMDDPRGYFAALRRSDVRTLIVHDERSGGFLAEGYARASGCPVAVSGNSGPGAANLVPGLLEAATASTPIVAVIGEARAPHPGLHAFQEADHRRLLAGVLKAVIEPRCAASVGAAAEQAVRLAQSDRSGPTMLLIDNELLWEPAEDGARNPAEARQTLDLSRSAAAADRFPGVAELLSRARRGLILAGGGALSSGAGSAIRALAERYAFPIALSPLAKGVVSDTSALGVASAYTSGANGLGKVAMEAAADADVLVVVGSDLDPITTAGRWPSGSTAVVRIDVDPSECLAVPAVNLVGDARASLEAFLGSQPAPAGLNPEQAAWRDARVQEAAKHRSEVLRRDLTQETDGVWPGTLVQRLTASLGPGDALVTDASYASAWAIDRTVQDWEGRFVFAPRAIGTLGWGLPASIGVKLARPEGTVVSLVGDGGLLFSLAEMKTALREGTDVIVVVLNNGVYGSQRQSNLLAQGMDYEDLHFGRTDFSGIARAVGWRSTRVSSIDECEEAYERARAGQGCSLIDVVVDPEARAPLTKFD